jgi:ribosome-associated protein
MTAEELKNRIPVSEFTFAASRSSGPGGQNVNKVNTKVELRYNVRNSMFLSDNEKDLVCSVLKNKINSEGDLIIICQSERTQLMNKKKAEEKFFKLLSTALTVKRNRKSTRPTAASKAKRLDTKKKRGTIKMLRKDKQVGED